VIGVNISPEQNTMNLQEAKDGVGELIDKVEQFQRGTAAEFTDTFTHVLSCEVLCHAADKMQLFASSSASRSPVLLLSLPTLWVPTVPTRKFQKTSRIATQRD
jgi:hypothetical protein